MPHVIDILLDMQYLSGPSGRKPSKKPSKKLQGYLTRYNGKTLNPDHLPKGLYVEDLCAGISLCRGVNRVILTHVQMSHAGTWRNGER